MEASAGNPAGDVGAASRALARKVLVLAVRADGGVLAVQATQLALLPTGKTHRDVLLTEIAADDGQEEERTEDSHALHVSG
jgi:hypothetical protein